MSLDAFRVGVLGASDLLQARQAFVGRDVRRGVYTAVQPSAERYHGEIDSFHRLIRVLCDVLLYSFHFQHVPFWPSRSAFCC